MGCSQGRRRRDKEGNLLAEQGDRHAFRPSECPFTELVNCAIDTR